MAVSHFLLRRKSAPRNLHTNFCFYHVRTYACMPTPYRAKRGMLGAKRRRTCLQTAHDANENST